MVGNLRSIASVLPYSCSAVDNAFNGSTATVHKLNYHKIVKISCVVKGS